MKLETFTMHRAAVGRALLGKRPNAEWEIQEELDEDGRGTQYLLTHLADDGKPIVMAMVRCDSLDESLTMRVITGGQTKIVRRPDEVVEAILPRMGAAIKTVSERVRQQRLTAEAGNLREDIAGRTARTPVTLHATEKGVRCVVDIPDNKLEGVARREVLKALKALHVALTRTEAL